VVIGIMVLIFLTVIVYMCCVRPKLDQRQRDRTIGRETPLVFRTLGGDCCTLEDWGTVRNLHAALAKSHPSLGDPRAFVLLATPARAVPLPLSADRHESAANDSTVIVGPRYRSRERAQLLDGTLAHQLILTFDGSFKPGAEAVPPRRAVSESLV
jgi:hypothetical protein